MAHGTYDNPRAGSNGSKSRMEKLSKKYSAGDPPEKSPAYKEFQSDSTKFVDSLDKGYFHHDIKAKYPLDMKRPPSQQKPESMRFYEDVKQGYSGQKYRNLPKQEDWLDSLQRKTNPTNKKNFTRSVKSIKK